MDYKKVASTQFNTHVIWRQFIHSVISGPGLNFSYDCLMLSAVGGGGRRLCHKKENTNPILGIKELMF